MKILIAVLMAAALAGCSTAAADAPSATSTSTTPPATASGTPASVNSATPTRTTPTPRPRPKPVKPALYFSGDYKVVLKMTRTTHPGYYRKSKTKKASWSISSACGKKRCRSAVDTNYVSEDFVLTYKSGHWRGTSSYKLHCVDTVTGKRAGPDVRERQTYDLKRTRSKGAVATRLEGVDHLRQLDACGGRERTTFHVVLSRR